MKDTARRELFAEKFPFFSALPADVRELLIARAVTVTYEGGAPLCGMRGRCIGLLCLSRGRARAYIRSAEGREITLCRLSPGDIFVMPSSGLFGIGAFDVTLEAEGHMSAEVLDAVTVSALLESDKDAEIFLLRTALFWYGAAIRAVRGILLERLDGRLAGFLLGEVERHGGDTVYLTQDEIARYIGSAREAISRTLKQFAAAGWITVLRGGVKLRDMQALRALLAD